MIRVGYRRELAPWIDSNPSEVGCLEFAESSWPTGHRRHLDDAVAWERSRSIPSAVGVLSNIGEVLL